jgi:hypothetical protein
MKGKQMRMTVLVVLMTLIAPMAASAKDQPCTTADVEWSGERPKLTNVHYVMTGVRMDLIGDYLWTQFETTRDPEVGGEVLSTLLTTDVTGVKACPDGLVTLTRTPLPVGELGTTETFDVIAYWQNLGYQVYGPR